MPDDRDQHPRLELEESVRYAIQLSRGYLEQLSRSPIPLERVRYLEIGPGADFAPQLVLASYGVQVTLADKYLAEWDPHYHPEFYRAFASAWDGRADAVHAVLARGNYGNCLRLLKEPVEALSSVPPNSFDFVLSNAVLEHVLNMRRAVAELARVTAPGGIHAHQVDFCDHRNRDKPLEHLKLNQFEYERLRTSSRGVHGTAQRMPELIEAFTRFFWVWDVNVNCTADSEYVEAIRRNLPDDSPYIWWPTPLLKQTGARLWLARKGTSHTARLFARNCQKELWRTARGLRRRLPLRRLLSISRIRNHTSS